MLLLESIETGANTDPTERTKSVCSERALESVLREKLKPDLDPVELVVDALEDVKPIRCSTCQYMCRLERPLC